MQTILLNTEGNFLFISQARDSLELAGLAMLLLPCRPYDAVA